MSPERSDAVVDARAVVGARGRRPVVDGIV